MTGTANLPASWKGAMNVTYRIGGPLNEQDWYIKLLIQFIQRYNKHYIHVV